MSIQEVKDETALPFTIDGQYTYWVRSKLEPTVLINGRTGDCFARRDGLKWEYPAYQVNRQHQTKNTVEAHTAHEDFVTYPPKTKRSAA